MKHTAFTGRLLILGFGSIGQGVLPLILRHIDMPKDRIEILTSDARGEAIAAQHDIRHTILPLTRGNYASELSARLKRGDFLLNLSVDISSVALVKLCREIGALYLDTCVEPWAGGYTDTSLSPSLRSNYALRESALALKDGAGPTAVMTHGANPGLVSHFVKQALLNVAHDTGHAVAMPKSRAEWATLAHELGVKVIHIAERDTQVAANVAKRRGEFVNTWSIDGFTGEGCQPAELGWGSHEKALPADGLRHDFGSDAAIYLMRPGAATRVRSWTPLEGPMHAFLITHNESISIADYYTRRDASGAVIYRPTAHYAYHPCDDAVLSLHEFAGQNWNIQDSKRLMMDEITSGMDELGVLLMGHKKGAYWYGSRLTIEDARALAPHNNATSLQVCAAVLAGVVFGMENPSLGVMEADELDHARMLEICLPYLGEMAGVYSGWSPLQDRATLFPEELDRDDPWQFGNFRVT
jgi:homospermidine synthase